MPLRLGLQHQVINGVENYGLPLDEVTLPDKLRAAGYKTYGVGKWYRTLQHFHQQPSLLPASLPGTLACTTMPAPQSGAKPMRSYMHMHIAYINLCMGSATQLDYWSYRYTPAHADCVCDGRRGFDHWFGFMNGYEDYWQHSVALGAAPSTDPVENGYVDLTDDNRVVRGFNGTYGPEMFKDKVHDWHWP